MNGRFRFFQRWRRIAAFQNPNRQFWVGRIRSLEHPDWQRLAGSKHSLKHHSVIAVHKKLFKATYDLSALG
jgi:hypothetical protein